ncbi:unnamed protein product [Blepharisma stoltei]|uniref:Uncharacterized protein n=1 Tax=Blepharisma stoltei TaxID=1481888 RepID=A0AAU9K8R5_9CILI|nr:unnamed protein product [Blepharisma stoltei]
MNKLLLGIFLLFAVAFEEIQQPSGECEDDPDCKAYADALTDAQEPTKEKIVKDLVAIKTDNSDLTFDKDGNVLMVISDRIDYYPYNSGDKFELKEDTMLTVYPFLQEECKTYTFYKTKRVIQALGFPPDSDMTGMIEVYVDLKKIFRGCPDPEISDKECQLDIQMKGQVNQTDNSPWYCAESFDQVSQKWVKINTEHFKWLCNKFEKSFRNEEIYDNSPWTGLGYTYDWGNEDHVGFSEFFAFEGTTVIFNKKKTIDEYCYA